MSSDPPSILAAGLTMAITAFLAVDLPAHRASRVDPAVALRQR